MDSIDKKKQQKITEDTPETVVAELRGVFDDAFYEEAKQIEAEMADFDLEMDAEQKARLKAKVMARFVAAEEAERAAKKEDATASAETEREEVAADSASTDGNVISGVTVAEADEEKKSKHSNIRIFRRIAVTAAVVCVAMVGITVQSQAGKDGIWSSIQRLIGSDSRWEQKDNGEDRQYTDPEEWKAVAKVEESLEIHMPEFYYWPDSVHFVENEIIDSQNGFVMHYTDDAGLNIYFEGWCGEQDKSGNYDFEGDGNTFYELYGDTEYKIIEIQTDEEAYPITYNVTWTVKNNKFLLSNIVNLTELRKILKNIKN